MCIVITKVLLYQLIVILKMLWLETQKLNIEVEPRELRFGCGSNSNSNSNSNFSSHSTKLKFVLCTRVFCQAPLIALHKQI